MALACIALFAHAGSVGASPTRRVTVRVPSLVNPGATFALSGTVAGAATTVVLQRSTRSGWISQRSARVTARRFMLRLVIPVGTPRLTVRVVARKSGRTVGRSAIRHITARQAVAATPPTLLPPATPLPPATKTTQPTPPSGRYVWRRDDDDPTHTTFLPDQPAANVTAIPYQINMGFWMVDANGNATWGPIPGRASSTTPPGYLTHLTDVSALALGESYSGDDVYILRRDGTVWAQGAGDRGQLGDGTQGTGRFASEPVRVGDLSDVIEIAAGSGDGYALKADGTVWAWGDDYAGALAGAQDEDALRPVRIPGLTGIISIASESGQFAVRDDGTVWVWGCAQNGEAGDGSEGRTLFSAIQVPGLSHIRDIVVNFGTVFAIDDQGHVQAWGWNWNGATGTGAAEETVLSPKPVPGVEDVVTATTGMALRSDGRLYTWGPGPPTLADTPTGVRAINGAGLVIADT